MRSRTQREEPVETAHRAMLARLEEAVEHLQARLEAVGDDVRYFQRGLVNRLVWAIVALALALGGKEVLLQGLT